MSSPIKSVENRLQNAIETKRKAQKNPLLDNVCFHVAINALGSRAKVENPSKTKSVSDILLRDKLHVTHHLTVTPDTPPEKIDEFINKPREIIARNGFTQPKKITGVLVLINQPYPDMKFIKLVHAVF